MKTITKKIIGLFAFLISITASAQSPGTSCYYDFLWTQVEGITNCDGECEALPDLSNCTPDNTINFSYTGAPQQWVVPCGVTSVEVEAMGASGMVQSDFYGGDNGDAGYGGKVVCNLSVTPGEVLHVYVGGTSFYEGFSGPGYDYSGWNGGAGNSESGAGGATDIRIGGTTLNDRYIVAGGGGYGTNCDDYYCSGSGGGHGGGVTANDGGYLTAFDNNSDTRGRGGDSFYVGAGGQGGCFTNPNDNSDTYCAESGSFGLGGHGASWAGNGGDGHGGGGYYGGGGGVYYGSGGGGSSYTEYWRTSNVSHYIGANYGHGSLKISYYSQDEEDYGSCYYDQCGVMNGDNTTCLDECGVPNGDNTACLDECGIVNGDNSSCSDECGVPNGDNTTCLDECGVINGDNSSCSDECGVPNGDNSSCSDECGVPNGDNSSCYDECGVPNGDNSSCTDECGVPNGDNSSCTDACGVPNGDNSSCTDECGVPNGDNSSCSDECGVPNGPGYYYAYIDTDGDGIGEGEVIESCSNLLLENNYVSTGGDIEITGCTNSEADNYLSSANTDDGTCIISGCTDSNYAEYNANANTDDGSCSCPVSVELNVSDASCAVNDGFASFSELECNSNTQFHQDLIDGCLEDGNGSDCFKAKLYSDINSIVPEETPYQVINCLMDGDNEICQEAYSLYPTQFIAALSYSASTSCLEGDGWACRDEFYNNNQDILSQGYSIHEINGCFHMGSSYSCEQALEMYPDEMEALVSNVSYSSNTSYLWQNSEGLLLSNQYYVSNLSPGMYSFTFSNSCCSYSQNFEVGHYCEGCTDVTAFNFDSSSNIDDGSCVAVVYGCTDASAFNFDSSSNTDDGSCVPVILGCTDQNAFNYNALANTLDDSCVAVSYGCTDASAFNFDSSSNTDDGSCVPVILGCTDPNAFNYNAVANTFDDSCIAVSYGCTDASAFNFDSSSNTEDGSCVPVILGCIDGSAFNYSADANTDDGSCNSVTLHNGWSMFGYTCLESQNVVEAFSEISESIEIVKDEWGLAYLPAWGFSAFENLAFGEGYQIKIIDDIIHFQFCEAIVPEDGIGPSDVDAAYESGYTDGVASVTPEDGITQADVDLAIADVHSSYEGWISPSYGCIDSEACNFNSNANINDGSCNYPNENYDCNGNIDVEIGDEAFGGIVFKINGDGTGLVADLVDLCSSCQHHTAVALCANSEAQGYNDWYLPSYGIVEDMMETIGARTVGGVDLPNYGNFSYNSGEPYYWWSSSETTPQFGSGPVFWVVHGFNSHSTYQDPWSWYRTRAVRAFP